MEADDAAPSYSDFENWNSEELERDNSLIYNSSSSSSNTNLLEISEHSMSYCGRSVVSLFRAVIMQALVDSMGQSKRTEDKIAKFQAMQWLCNNGKDFQMVCLLADLNPTWVIRKAKNAIAKASISRASSRIRETHCIKIKANSRVARSYGATRMS